MVDPHQVDRVLVDARPLAHPTAGGRGVGNHVHGLLEGFAALGAPVTALVGARDERAALDGVDVDVDLLGRAAIRRAATPGTWFLATSLFLHPISIDPVPASVTEARLRVAALLYDVIPYRYPEQYLERDDPRRQARLRAVLSHTIDTFCTNSEFVSATARDALALDPRRLHVTGCGVASRFRPGDRLAARAVARRHLAGSHQSVVVAITGADDRKNTDGLLRAWSRVADGIRRSHTLVVVAGAPATVLDRWLAAAAALGVAGSVRFAVDADDAEVVAILQTAELVVVPSLEEGFGLPVLEAAACGAPVVCSGVSSLPEVLPEPQAHFDPDDEDEMGRVIERALTDGVLRATLLAAADAALVRWTWRRVAADVIAAMAATGGPRAATRVPRRRVAVLAETGPAAADLATGLRDRLGDVEVVLGLDPADPPDPSRPAGRVPFGAGTFPAVALGRYVKPGDFDAIVAVVDRGAASERLRRVAARCGAPVVAVDADTLGRCVDALDLHQ